jgi:hypothetical protein
LIGAKTFDLKTVACVAARDRAVCGLTRRTGLFGAVQHSGS